MLLVRNYKVVRVGVLFVFICVCVGRECAAVVLHTFNIEGGGPAVREDIFTFMFMNMVVVGETVGEGTLFFSIFSSLSSLIIFFSLILPFL